MLDLEGDLSLMGSLMKNLDLSPLEQASAKRGMLSSKRTVKEDWRLQARNTFFDLRYHPEHKWDHNILSKTTETRSSTRTQFSSQTEFLSLTFSFDQPLLPIFIPNKDLFFIYSI